MQIRARQSSVARGFQGYRPYLRDPGGSGSLIGPGFIRALSARPLIQRSDVRQVAEPLVVIEAVADGEAVGDLEADIPRREVHLPALGFGEQRAHLEARRIAGAEVAQEVLEREPRVD